MIDERLIGGLLDPVRGERSDVREQLVAAVQLRRTGQQPGRSAAFDETTAAGASRAVDQDRPLGADRVLQRVTIVD